MAFQPTRGFNSRVRIEVDVPSLQSVLGSMLKMGKEGKEQIRVVLKEVTGKMVPEAKALTPDDPETAGLLRDSVRILTPQISRTTGKISAGIIVGGKALEARLKGHAYSAWAITQHEDLTLKHPHGGEPKFLEKPFYRHIDEVPDAILEALDKVGGGV